MQSQWGIGGARNITDVSISTLTNLRSLTIRFHGDITYESLFLLTNLTELDLSHSNQVGRNYELISNLTNLISLRCFYPPDALKNSTHLRALDLECDTLLNSFQFVNNVTSLTLVSATIEEGSLSRLTQLKKLVLCCFDGLLLVDEIKALTNLELQLKKVSSRSFFSFFLVYLLFSLFFFASPFFYLLIFEGSILSYTKRKIGDRPSLLFCFFPLFFSSFFLQGSPLQKLTKLSILGATKGICIHSLTNLKKISIVGAPNIKENYTHLINLTKLGIANRDGEFQTTSLQRLTHLLYLRSFPEGDPGRRVQSFYDSSFFPRK